MERFAPGTRIGDYLIDGAVAGGNSELTYQATHVLLPRRACLQILHPAFTGLAPVAVQLIREGCILEALHHLGVPRMYECGVLADRRPWMATELVEGETVAQLVAAAPYDAVAIVDLIRDVADILEHAHRRGVVHRNLRPEAIVRCAASRGFGYCVVDWGHARIQDTAATQLVVSGSPCYRAPELASGRFDGRADVFALGVIAYEALTRTLPTMSATRRCPGAPIAVTALIDRMIAIDPTARPTAADVRLAATQLVELVELPPADESPVELAEIAELVELPDEAPAPLISRRLRWTPAHGLETQPGIHRAAIALKRGRP